MKRLVCLLFLVLGVACAALAEAPARDLTVMVYMCGSNLESEYGSASADYREMVEAGVGGNVSVLAMMGGSASWQMAISPDSASVMEISGKGARMVRETEKRNMGDPETLADFLRFAREQCPAKAYALILWDHGGGPLDGLCWDEQYGADHLSLSELTGALKAAGFGEEKLSWIGFDACLMGTAEVAGAMAPYAEMMVSSQAEEPASGWNYAFLRDVGTDPETAGRQIVDAYFAGTEDTARDLTLACIRLDAVGELAARMDAFFEDLTGMLTRDSFADISRLRLKATGFGRAAEAEGGYDLVDLLSLTESYAGKSPEKARGVAEALEAAVLYARANVAGSCGLSVYHPWRNREKYTGEWQEEYAGLAFCTGYTRYVNAYGGIMAGDHLVLWDRMDRITAVPEENATRITAELTADQAENLAGAQLVILARNLFDAADASFSLVYRSPAVELIGGHLTASWGGTHLRAENVSGYTELTGALSYRVTEDGLWQVPLYPVDADGHRSETPILAEYVKDARDQFTLKDYLVQDSLTGAWTSRAEVDLNRYAAVTFLNETRVPTANSRSEMLAFDAWDADTHETTQMKARYDERTDFRIGFGKDLYRAEALYAAFEITDAQGYHVMTDLVPLDGGGVTEYPALEGSIAGLGDFKCSLVLQPSTNLNASRIILNLAVENSLKEDIIFLVDSVTLNGRESSAAALCAPGSGSVHQGSGRRSVAPGETGMLSLALKQEDLSALAPDVLLEKVGFTLTASAVEGGEARLLGSVALDLPVKVPLDAFYPETDAVPPAFLVEYGKEIGALDEASEQALFDGADCRVSLRGFYIVGPEVVLRLHYENRGATEWKICLGDAEIDSAPADIGQTRDVTVQTRNNRVSSYGLEADKWEAPVGVSHDLGAGEALDEYVSVKPRGQTEVRRVSFRAYCYNREDMQDAVLFTPAVIETPEEAAPLTEDMRAVAPAEDYVVTPGERAAAEPAREFFEDSTADVPAVPGIVMEVRDEERIHEGFWYLLRRVTSDAELAEMNILNPVSEETGQPQVRFEGEWLLFEAMGDLTVQEDGSAKAEIPGLLPAARTGGESMPLMPCYVQRDGTYSQVVNHLGFTSKTFAGAVLPTVVGAIDVHVDEDGHAALVGSKQIDGNWPSLAEMVYQRAILTPADGDLQAFLVMDSYLNWPYALRQYQLMKSEKFTLAMEPIAGAEKYVVVYRYLTESGKDVCTAPVGLGE